MRSRLQRTLKFCRSHWPWLLPAMPLVVIAFGTALLHLAAMAFEYHAGQWDPPFRERIDSPGQFSVSVYASDDWNASIEDLPVILIHGSPGDASNFGDIIRMAPEKYLMIAYDRPDYRGTMSSITVGNLKSQTAVARYVIEGTAGRPCIAIGHSYGGPIALQLAIEYPGLVKGVILIGAAVDPGLEKIHLLQKAAAHPLLEWTLPKAFRLSNEELIQLGPDLIELRHRLPELTVPIVMIHGGEDRLVPVENCDYLLDELRKAGLESLLTIDRHREWNHFIPWEHPSSVLKAIDTMAGMSSSTGREQEQE